MDDQRTDRKSGGSVGATAKKRGVVALNTILRRGVMLYITGLAAMLGSLYLLPAARASFFLFFGGMLVFFASNVMVITSAMALEFVAAREGLWHPTWSTLALTAAVLTLTTWHYLLHYVWP